MTNKDWFTGRRLCRDPQIILMHLRLTFVWSFSKWICSVRLSACIHVNTCLTLFTCTCGNFFFKITFCRHMMLYQHIFFVNTIQKAQLPYLYSFYARLQVLFNLNFNLKLKKKHDRLNNSNLIWRLHVALFHKSNVLNTTGYFAGIHWKIMNNQKLLNEWFLLICPIKSFKSSMPPIAFCRNSAKSARSYLPYYYETTILYPTLCSLKNWLQSCALYYAMTDSSADNRRKKFDNKGKLLGIFLLFEKKTLAQMNTI